MPRKGDIEDLTGRVFGRLTVTGRGPNGYRNGRPVATWVCACACGATVGTKRSDLVSGDTKSCGCLKRDLTSALRRKHGATIGGRTPEYRTWKAMRQRCESPRYADFANYGGRGIAVCARWRESFAAFLADMGRKPSPAHTIERINNDGNYEPGNCRWATQREQSRNTRRNHILEFNGVRMPLVEWSERQGISFGALLARVRRGWTTERALFQVARSRHGITRDAPVSVHSVPTVTTSD